MLDLLKFKKLLSTGVLDTDGENIVMIGESQLKKLIQSVETMTENLEKADSAQERQEQREAIQDEVMATIQESEGKGTVTVGGDTKGLEQLNALLTSSA